MRVTRAAAVVGSLLLAIACGAQAVRRAGSPMQASAADAAGSADADAVDAAPDVDPIALLAASKDDVAPGMRELARHHLELADGGVLELPTATTDTCFRAALAATELVDVAFVDGAGASLAEARGTEPRLGSRGPVCVRKGQALRVTIRGAGTVDAIIWASP